MELVTPEIGLIFWTTIVFLILLIVLKKYAWKPILSAVDERNKNIEEAFYISLVAFLIFIWDFSYCLFEYFTQVIPTNRRPTDILLLILSAIGLAFTLLGNYVPLTRFKFGKQYFFFLFFFKFN